MLVSNVLEGKGTLAWSPSAREPRWGTCADLARHRVGRPGRVARRGTIEGIVSERDIVQQLSVLRTELLDEPVSSIMSTVGPGVLARRTTSSRS